MGGKIKWGETIYETAERELKEETGLRGKIKLVGIKHKIDYSVEGNLLEDKFFFIFVATKLQGRLIHKLKEGENYWLTEEEIRKLPTIFNGVDITLKIIKGKSLSFVEKKYKVKKY